MWGRPCLRLCYHTLLSPLNQGIGGIESTIVPFLLSPDLILKSSQQRLWASIAYFLKVSHSLNSSAEFVLIATICNYNEEDFKINNIAWCHYAASMVHSINWWDNQNDHRWQGTIQRDYYLQLENSRGQECSSIGKLCNCNWHSASIVSLIRMTINRQRKALTSFLKSTPAAFFLE